MRHVVSIPYRYSIRLLPDGRKFRTLALTQVSIPYRYSIRLLQLVKGYLFYSRWFQFLIGILFDSYSEA